MQSGMLRGKTKNERKKKKERKKDSVTVELESGGPGINTREMFHETFFKNKPRFRSRMCITLYNKLSERNLGNRNGLGHHK